MHRISLNCCGAWWMPLWWGSPGDASMRDASWPRREAASETPVVVSNDLTGETRWPKLSSVAVASGIGSVVCFGLGARGRWFGALSLYGREAFASSGSEAYETGPALAAVASLAGPARRSRDGPSCRAGESGCDRAAEGNPDGAVPDLFR